MIEWILLAFAVSNGPDCHVCDIGPGQPGPRKRSEVPGVAMTSITVPGFPSEVECTTALRKLVALSDYDGNVDFMGLKGTCISRTKQ
jgi:hypothetical protein